MAEISASMVMELRQRTGLGMMECKKALTEAEGDMAKAEELLRIKSGAKASKAAGRVAAEGVIGLFVAPDAKLAAMVEVNCETDFVATQRRLPGVRQRSRADSSRATNPADVAALGARRSRRATRSRRAAWRSCRRSARTCRSAASCASRRAGHARVVRPRRRRSACCRRRRAATRRSARISRCTSPRTASRIAVSRERGSRRR